MLHFQGFKDSRNEEFEDSRIQGFKHSRVQNYKIKEKTGNDEKIKEKLQNIGESIQVIIYNSDKIIEIICSNVLPL